MLRPLVISHAACGGHAPENTLAGIRKAIELRSDAIEIDLHVTADGVPVLMHDETVDRTTNGAGAIRDLTFERVQSLDAGGEPPPSLESVLRETKGKVLLVMEIKQPGIEDRVVDVVLSLGALDHVMTWSFFPQALEAMRRIEPRIPGALLLSPQTLANWPDMRSLAVRLGLQGVSVFSAGVTESVAADCARSALALYTWTADAESEIARLIELGVDGICTNYPDRAVAMLAGSKPGDH